MADATEDVATVEPEIQAKTDSSINGEKVDPTKVDTEVKANGKTDEVDENSTADTTESKGSQSPDQKRKDAPDSMSAHERKRPRGGHSNAKINSRFDDQPESNDAEEIRRQVEFYFSDSNLPIDAYLLAKTGGHENLPVDLKVIHNFKRMRHFQPFSAVRDAVKASNFLDLNEHDEITRKVPLNEKFTDDAVKNRSIVHSSSMPRSIYAKGFGEEDKSTHLDIESFFAPYGPLKSVRLRRGDDGWFKGSVFVEFESDELQQSFLDLDPMPQWNGTDLQIMSKQEYVDMKHQGIIDGIVKPRAQNSEYNNRSFRGKGRRFDDKGGRGSKDKFDKDDWKTRRDRDQQHDRRHGRGGRGRGGRGGRGGRRDSPEFRDRKRSRRDDDEGDEGKEDRGDTANVEERSAAVGGAADGQNSGIESKKRGLEDGGDGQGEAKKVKDDDS